MAKQIDPKIDSTVRSIRSMKTKSAIDRGSAQVSAALRKMPFNHAQNAIDISAKGTLKKSLTPEQRVGLVLEHAFEPERAALHLFMRDLNSDSENIQPSLFSLRPNDWSMAASSWFLVLNAGLQHLVEHEVGNPLVSMKTFSQIAADTMTADPVQTSVLRSITESVRKIKQISEQFTGFQITFPQAAHQMHRHISELEHGLLSVDEKLLNEDHMTLFGIACDDFDKLDSVLKGYLKLSAEEVLIYSRDPKSAADILLSRSDPYPMLSSICKRSEERLNMPGGFSCAKELLAFFGYISGKINKTDEIDALVQRLIKMMDDRQV